MASVQMFWSWLNRRCRKQDEELWRSHTKAHLNRGRLSHQPFGCPKWDQMKKKTGGLPWFMAVWVYQTLGFVGGLIAIFYFPIGFLIIPIDFHIFQRGGPGPPTSCWFERSFYVGWTSKSFQVKAGKGVGGSGTAPDHRAFRWQWMAGSSHSTTKRKKHGHMFLRCFSDGCWIPSTWRQLQTEVDQACDVFKRFNHQLEDGHVPRWVFSVRVIWGFP